MAHRAFPWLLALVFALGATLPLVGAIVDRTPAIERSADSHVMANAPLQNDKMAPMFGQWSDDNNPDDLLQVGDVSLPVPSATSGHGRRISGAVHRQRLLSAAFPRGPPSA